MQKLLMAVALWLTMSVGAQAKVDYAIDLTSPEHHRAQVEILFPAGDAPYFDVKMAAWRTGRYDILDLANGVRGFAATDAVGAPLSWKKIDKSTWRIMVPKGAGSIRVGYEIYGDELGLRTRHIDDSHAYLNASAVFMYADRFRDDEATVSLKVPSDWKSYSGMASIGDHQFVAPNWDVLTDSPIETGINILRQFQVDGRDYDLVIWGQGNYDADQIAADLAKIVAQADAVWTGTPFDRYLFILHAADNAGGATEHINSTVIQGSRYRFRSKDGYQSFLNTAAHEIVHAWNVKSYRPSGLVPYDFQRENYSNLLWMAEGTTSYFAPQFLIRAELMTVPDYFDALARAVEANRNNPGRAIQSVAEASFDEWISTGGDRALNDQVNIYAEGALVSWMLDIGLLERSKGKYSLRDVHDRLFARFKVPHQGYTDRDVIAILEELTGGDWSRWWTDHVEKPISPDFSALLAPVGLKLVEAEPNKETTASAGWSATEDPNGMRLTAVPRGSPAWDAGFVPGDIIVALDGQRANKARFDAAINERKPQDRMTISYFRRDQLMQKSLTLGGPTAGKPRIVPVEKPSRCQKALFERWLLLPFPSGKEKPQRPK